MFKCWFAAIKAKEQVKDNTGWKRAKKTKKVEEGKSWWSPRPLCKSPSSPLPCLCAGCIVKGSLQNNQWRCD